MSANYNSTIAYLYEQLPMYHRVGKPAYKTGLENAYSMDKYFGSPHRKYETIHVAGTNGKGSVCHMLASVLQQAGYKVGLHTSPHLIDFRERIKVNGKPCSRKYVIDFIKKHKDIIEAIHPSFFEVSVFMAFHYFVQQSVDVAIVEVGLGGRLDTTNIITPVLSVITNIGKDHMEFLGDTLGKIAEEKAGIIKPEIPVIIGETHPLTVPVFKRIAAQKKAPLYFADQIYQIDYSLFTTDGFQMFNVKKSNRLYLPNLKNALLGTYQRKNTVTLLQAVDLLRQKGFAIAEIDIYAGLKKVVDITGMQGRWQMAGYNPRIILDAAHNTDGMKEVVNQISAMAYENLHMVISFVSDKDIDAIISQLPVKAKYYFTRSSVPRSMDQYSLKKLAARYGLSGETYTSVNEAVNAVKAEAGRNDLVLITGSIFLLSDFLVLQKKQV
ncbi:MAG: bifunctional folylpolyglutamate synthase/dihydrofolate synthase [Bacteroidales bacterium]|nr:bifunctional folylpolyglutamate synthase/dihydrofolate synthase [Bacteroidales bacterium]MBN2762129.1 bifunctional folylpolyglutamate synthase/dihydrofolate synthase [Bacteroidales bacterium]